MITMTTACTREADDAEQAVRDILGQLDLPLLAKYSAGHSAGLVFCNYEFIESGVLEAVCAALPFEAVGCTTQGAAVPGAIGHIMLTVTVLSSDKVTFATAVSEPLTEDPDARMAAAFENAAARLGDAASMMFAFQPYLQNLRGDTVLRALDAVSGNVPVFGSIALDFTTHFRSPMAIGNGHAYSDRLPLLLLSSAAKPRFFAESLPQGRAVIRQRDMVTDARDNILITVNNVPAAEYMEKLGFASNGVFNGAQLSLPVLLDYHDGEKPKACSFYDITPEGYVRCGGEIPVGAEFSIGSLGHGDVIDSVGDILREALACNEAAAGKGGLLLFSCFSRNIALGERSAEIQAVRDGMARASLPYSFMYSGGELCPLYNSQGDTVNRFHNYSIIGCLL